MNLCTRPSPADVDLVGWARARADAGLVAIASDFYDQFAESAPLARAHTAIETRARLRDRLRAIDNDVEVGLGGHDKVLHPYDFGQIGPALTDALASAVGSGWTPAVQADGRGCDSSSWKQSRKPGNLRRASAASVCELLQQGAVVPDAPMLDDAAVVDAEDVRLLPRDDPIGDR